MYVETKNPVLLQIAKGYISTPSDSANVALSRLLFDGGSWCSFISTRLKDSLALPVTGQKMPVIKTFGSNQSTLQTCDIVHFCVRSPYNDLNIYVNAYVTPVVCAALRNQAIEFAASSCAHLASLPLADFPIEGEEDLSIGILIGSNYYWLFLSGMSVRGKDHLNEPVELDSRFGWILSGPVGRNPSVSSVPMNLVQTHAMQLDTEEMTLEKQLSRFWELESLGIFPQENSVYETFKEGIGLSMDSTKCTYHGNKITSFYLIILLWLRGDYKVFIEDRKEIPVFWRNRILLLKIKK